MSVIGARNPASSPAAPALSRTRTRAGVAIGAHSVCDFFSFMAISLIPLLTARLHLETGQIALLLGLGSVTSGVVQPLVAWASDRLDTRVLGTAGLVVAVACISMIGRARSYEMLMFLHGLGAAGIGAFHPPAAAAVGQLAGARRSLGVAVFFLAGMLGGVLGNILTPKIVNLFAWANPVRHEFTLPIFPRVPLVYEAPDVTFGLTSLTWLVIPGLIAAVALGWAIHSAPHRRHDAHDSHGRLSARERRARWLAVGVLYTSNVLRFSVNMALVYLFAQWAEAHVASRVGGAGLAQGLDASELNGPLQGMMQIGMGAGGITLGFLLGVRFEKLAFVVFPVLGAAAIALIPMAGSLAPGGVAPAVFALGVVSGVGFGSVIPVSMALAQRLLPHRTSLASGLMLGGAWALAFVGPLVAKIVHAGVADMERTGRALGAIGVSGGRVETGWGLETAFHVTAVALLVAGLIAMLLPHRLIVDSAGSA